MFPNTPPESLSSCCAIVPPRAADGLGDHRPRKRVSLSVVIGPWSVVFGLSSVRGRRSVVSLRIQSPVDRFHPSVKLQELRELLVVHTTFRWIGFVGRSEGDAARDVVNRHLTHGGERREPGA